jgi:hypothetical protein
MSKICRLHIHTLTTRIRLRHTTTRRIFSPTFSVCRSAIVVCQWRVVDGRCELNNWNAQKNIVSWRWQAMSCRQHKQALWGTESQCKLCSVWADVQNKCHHAHVHIGRDMKTTDTVEVNLQMLGELVALAVSAPLWGTNCINHMSGRVRGMSQGCEIGDRSEGYEYF